jgi:hypothetical protein
MIEWIKKVDWPTILATVIIYIILLFLSRCYGFESAALLGMAMIYVEISMNKK